MRLRLRPWHWVVVALASTIVLLLLWVGLAYGGLPRLWSHHEHKRIGTRQAITAFTAQDIPADPINLEIVGTAPAIACAFAKAGWTRADAVSIRSSVKIMSSVLFDRAFPDAPVSSLYLDDRVQDVAYEQDKGRSAHRRHHVRLWQVAPNRWLAAATYDRGVGLSLFTLQVTHHIGWDVDADRDRVGALLVAAGGRPIGTRPSRVAPGRWHRNGGGDRYRTDGLIKIYAANPACH